MSRGAGAQTDVKGTALQGFLEAAPDAIVVVDQVGCMVTANRLTEAMFGYDRDELVGQPIEILVPERLRAAHVRHRSGYVLEPRTRPMGAGLALSGRRKDGVEFPVEISLSPLSTSVGTQVVLAAIRDISARKLVETKLRSSLREKEVLLKEVHHRVKNNLQIVSSMLSLQMDQVAQLEKVTRDLALRVFRESQARVRSIALFHEKLYQSEDLAHVDISEYLNGVAAGLFATYAVSPEDVTLSIQVDDVPLSVDAAIPCGLIVNELVSNALKHAFPGGRTGTVEVRLRAEGAQAVLEVRDSGIGFPQDLDLRSPNTLGLRLVCIFTEQLGGTIELDRSGGTRFTVRFERGEHA